MTLNALARGAGWRMRVKGDVEAEGVAQALREVSGAFGMGQETAELGFDVPARGSEFGDGQVSHLETETMSKSGIRRTLNSLYSRYASESRLAYREGNTRQKRITTGKFNAIVALQVNLRY